MEGRGLRGGHADTKAYGKRLNNGRGGCPVSLAVYRFYRPVLDFNFRSSIPSNPCYRTIVSISFKRKNTVYRAQSESNWLSILSIRRECNICRAEHPFFKGIHGVSFRDLPPAFLEQRAIKILS
mgnify:CR=1 FL=1